jgi:hypothetical protein
VPRSALDALTSGFSDQRSYQLSYLGICGEALRAAMAPGVGFEPTT